jgi:hypothetical protein
MDIFLGKPSDGTFDWILGHADPLQVPFWIECTSGTSKLFLGGGARRNFEYSSDGCRTWTKFFSSEQIQIQEGQRIYFRADGFVDGVTNQFTTDTQIRTRIGGNIMSLLWNTGYARKTDFSELTNQSFSMLFSNHALGIVDASELLLPATTLREYEYSSMFSGQREMLYAPKFPATSIANSCYNGMFQECSKLKEIVFPKVLENDETFLGMNGSPKFGAENATVLFV